MPNTDLQELFALLRMRATPADQETAFPSLTGSAGPTTTNTEISAGPVSNQGTLNEMGRLTAEIEQLRQIASTQTGSVQANTDAVLLRANTKSSTSGSASDIFGKVFSSTIESGFGLAPMISGLFHLFGGGSTPDPVVPLQKFALPSAVNMDAGVTSTRQFAEASYTQDGLPRATPNAGSQQVQVTIHAMDSRSFLDHSDDIAKAVKEAMLNSHSLNDVVADL